MRGRRLEAKRLPVAVGILLGGDSRRFGFPKAFLPVGERTAAADLAVRAARVASEVLVAGRTPAQVPADVPLFVRWVRDTAGGKGPLAGLRAVLEAVESPAVFVTAVDMPGFRPAVVRGLWQIFRSLHRRPDAVVPRVRERWQPLCALWNPRAAEKLAQGAFRGPSEALESGLLRVAVVEEERLRRWCPRLRCLTNRNTPPRRAGERYERPREGGVFPALDGLVSFPRRNPIPERNPWSPVPR